MPLESHIESFGRTGRSNLFVRRGERVTDQRVEIVSIRDDQTAYHGGQEAVEVKGLERNDDMLRIRYRVVGYTQQISLWVEHEASEMHEHFYAQYRTSSFQPPRVASLVEDEVKGPGEYVVEWNGRDHTAAERLLLPGRYTVHIVGEDIERPLPADQATDVTDLEVAKPTAFNFGINYRKGGREESTEPEVEHAVDAQRTLRDGTGFSAQMQFALTADEALAYMQDASVVYWSGHSNPEQIFFHSTEGEAYRRQDKSSLDLFGSNVEAPDAGIMDLWDEDDSALKDLFLIVLNGCRTGNEVYMVQRVLRQFHPQGIDGVHGPRTTGALEAFQFYNELEPADGTKNEQTLAWFGLASDARSEAAITREIQRRLTSYFPGPLDGKMGPRTERALRNYQTDHPSLTETGVIDTATLEALSLGRRVGEEASVPVNLSSAMGYIGADLVLGFEHKIGFSPAEDWAMAFWDELADGQGVNTAAHNAVATLDHRYRDEMEFRIYAQDGISPEATLHPARYGRASRE